MESIRTQDPDEVIVIDGKTMRGAKQCKHDTDMPHIVSAWASANGICLGQVRVAEKSNEITAIPELIDLIVTAGCTFTIDAMGCQRNIVSKIIENGGDYMLATKGNQGSLQQAIKDTIRFSSPVSVDTTVDCGHGRIETRKCSTYSDLTHIETPESWAGISTIVVIDSVVFEKASGKERKEQRLYISSLAPDAGRLNSMVRSHWSIENNLHWVLDVTFGEDLSRKRKGFEAENFSLLSKSIIPLLVNDKTPKLSKKRKKMKAALDQTYREKLLGF